MPDTDRTETLADLRASAIREHGDPEARRIAEGLTEAQAAVLIASLGDTPRPWPGGRVAAGLARRSPPLCEYAEHDDVRYGGRLTMRRAYMATPLGRRVAEYLRGRDL